MHSYNVFRIYFVFCLPRISSNRNSRTGFFLARPSYTSPSQIPSHPKHTTAYIPYSPRHVIFRISISPPLEVPCTYILLLACKSNIVLSVALFFCYLVAYARLCCMCAHVYMSRCVCVWPAWGLDGKDCEAQEASLF